MPNGTTERVKKLSERAFTSGSRAEVPQAGGISTSNTPENDLLIAVIVLGIIVFALIVVIIYGYCKWVRGGGGKGETTEDAQQPASASELDEPSEKPQMTVPVKMRKRSMTFSETDEECRKYREDLADSYTGQVVTVVDNCDRSRKKSFVTFAGVEEIDANDA